MRISTIKGTKGYTKCSHMFIVLFNNSELLKAVMIADEEESYAICYELDSHGNPVYTMDKKSIKFMRYDGPIRIGFHPQYEEILLDEDKGLSPEEFIKKYDPQQDAAKSRSKTLH